MAADGWIAYVGPFLFPWGQPGSRRVCGIAKSLARAGYRVFVASGDEGPAAPELLASEGDGEVRYQGIGELHRADQSRFAKVFKALVVQGRRSVRWLESRASKPSHVIVYGGYAPFMARLMPWCKTNGVPVVADVVEWYEGSHQPGGALGPFAMSSSLALRYYYPRCDGVIAISSFLRDYYKRRGVTAVRIPPTLDVREAKARVGVERTSPGRLHLIYAGTPGKKDLVVNVIRGVSAVDPDGERVRLTVIGVSERDVRRLMRAGERLPRSVMVMGRVSQTEVADAYLGADFSVLLRPPKRYAQAGFPTKVAESLAAGVPVICNLTSDIGEYVRDGVEGIHCADYSSDAFAEGVRRALEMSNQRLSEMAQSARLAAERYFDYRAYCDALDTFLVQVAK